MNRPDTNQQLRSEWIERQRVHGKQSRAVLMKGLHPLLNDTIDRWHKAVLRAAFAPSQALTQSQPSLATLDRALDVGCGYGRLAGVAADCGLAPVGIDFAPRFCVDFAADHGPAVCAELSRLPFADGVFAHAYAVTALMYLDGDTAAAALREIDRCMQPGARILVLEPSREFNVAVRSVLRRKRHETLTMPGFSLEQVRAELAPAHWRPRAAGCARWMTLMLPLLAVCTRVPSLYRRLSAMAEWLDRPRPGRAVACGRLVLYRWVVYEKC